MAEIRPKNRARKRRDVGRIYGMKYSWKAIQTETDTKTEQKGVGERGWFMLKTFGKGAFE